MRIPCTVWFVRKSKFETDSNNGKQKRVSEQTKNELFYEMISGCSEGFRFDYVCGRTFGTYRSKHGVGKVIGHRSYFGTEV